MMAEGNEKQTKELVEDLKGKIHFKGKDRFSFDEPNRPEALRKLEEQIDKLINKAVMKEYMEKGDYMSPQITEREYLRLKAEIYKELLRKKGATEEELKEMEEATCKAAKIIAEEHKQHVASFKAIDGNKVQQPCIKP